MIRFSLEWTLNGILNSESEVIDEMHGAKCNNSTIDKYLCNFSKQSTPDEMSLTEQCKMFWKLENPETKPRLVKIGENTELDEKEEMSDIDKEVLQFWREETSFGELHYTVPIPFKTPDPVMPDISKQTIKRQNMLRARMLKSPEFGIEFKEGMQKLIDKRYVEIAPEDVPEAWLLPLFAAYHPFKPKPRIVFDCAAEEQGISLNSVVHQGPDLSNSIKGVTYRFREGFIRVQGDLEAMYYQVWLPEEQKKYVRFLWWTDGDTSKEPVQYQFRVHLFGGTWCPAAATFCIRLAGEEQIAEFGEDVLKAIRESFYVDDMLNSQFSTQETISILSRVSKCLENRGFNLTKIVSNSKEVLETVPENKRAVEPRSMDLQSTDQPIERALGLWWDVRNDTFYILRHPKDLPFTRRGVLKCLSSVYDPLGMVACIVLQAKLIFQSECRRELAWDVELTPENEKLWQAWIDGLPELRTLSIPAGYFPVGLGKPIEIQHHHFCDGNEQAYGAVSFVRAQFQDGTVSVMLIQGRSRLAPLAQHLSVPRLELCAAVLAVESGHEIEREHTLKPNKVVHWSDSAITIQVIQNKSKRFKTFVANRRQLILDHTSPEQWRFVNTQDNVADEISRGLSAAQLLKDKRYIYGPDFLYKAESDWPKFPTVNAEPLENNEKFKVEIKREVKACAIHMVEWLQEPDAQENSDGTIETNDEVIFLTTSGISEIPVDHDDHDESPDNCPENCPVKCPVIDPESVPHVPQCLAITDVSVVECEDCLNNLNNYESALPGIPQNTHIYITVDKDETEPFGADRIIAYCSEWTKLVRIVTWFRIYGQWLKAGKPKPVSKIQRTAKDTKSARMAILKYVQKSHYSKEIETGTIHKQSDIYHLDPYIDSAGYIRVKSRLEYAELPEEVPTCVTKEV